MTSSSGPGIELNTFLAATILFGVPRNRELLLMVQKSEVGIVYLPFLLRVSYIPGGDRRISELSTVWKEWIGMNKLSTGYPTKKTCSGWRHFFLKDLCQCGWFMIKKLACVDFRGIETSVERGVIVRNWNVKGWDMMWLVYGPLLDLCSQGDSPRNLSNSQRFTIQDVSFTAWQQENKVVQRSWSHNDSVTSPPIRTTTGWWFCLDMFPRIIETVNVLERNGNNLECSCNDV